MTIQTNKNITPTKPERVSVPGIKNKANKNREKEYAYGRKGSVTIEASLGIPVSVCRAVSDMADRDSEYQDKRD